MRLGHMGKKKTCGNGIATTTDSIGEQLGGL